MPDDARVDDFVRFPQSLRPFRDAESFAIEGHPSATAHIARLGFPRRPDAVLGSVVAITVDPLDRIRRVRARTHVGIEVREAVAPLRADANSAPAIVAPSWIPRIATAVAHLCPNIVLGACRQAVALSKRGLHEGLQAPAARCVPPAKVGRAQHSCATTVASALPEHAAVAATSVGRTHYDKSPKTLPCDLQRRRHSGRNYHAVAQSSTTQRWMGI